MTVTELAELSKSRSKIYIDMEYAFILYKGEMRRYGIRKGEELKEEDYWEIIKKILPKRAKLRCMNLLKSRQYTEKQLRDKLHAGQYPKESIEEAIAYVKSYRYVNDDDYAREYISSRSVKSSKKQIERDLMNKGIPAETLSRIFVELQEEGIEPDEEALIRRWMIKKHFQPAAATKEEAAKFYGFLYRKGFSTESIRKSMKISFMDFQ